MVLLFNKIKLKMQLDALEKSIKTILVSDVDDNTKITEILKILSSNKELIKEQNDEGNTFIHMMARAINGDSYYIEKDVNQSKCYKNTDKILIKNTISTGYTREIAYKIKELFMSDSATEKDKKDFVSIIKDAYKIKNYSKSPQTPEYFAEKCDKNFYDFMNVNNVDDDNDNNNDDNGDNINNNDDDINNDNNNTNTNDDDDDDDNDDNDDNGNINRIEEYENDKIFKNLEELYDYRNIISDESIFKVMVSSYTGALRIGTYKIINRDDIFKKYEDKDDKIIINCECLSERTYNNKIAFHSDRPTTKICNNNNIEIVCEKEKGYSFTSNDANVNKITMMIVHKNPDQGGKIKNIRIIKSRKSKKSRKTRKPKKSIKSRKSRKSRKTKKTRKSKKHRRSHRR